MNRGEPHSELLTAHQVAKWLNVSTSWVRDHASGRAKPVLPSLKMGQAVRFERGQIKEFVERCRRAMQRGLPLQ
jgi:hypothetical protein